MFKGGVHLKDFKEISKNENIEGFPYPKKVVIPLSQHTGLPAKPVVKKGDIVSEGQVIGEANGFISSFIHSSISGKITGIENCLLPSGKKSLSVIIENNGEIKKNSPIYRDWLNLKPEEIINIVREAGIVGMGGAAFPTAVKLSIPPGKKAEIVLLNGCECEPYLTCDYRVLKESTFDVVEGLEIICKTVSVNKACIGIEKNKIDLLPLLKKSFENIKTDLKIDVKVLPEKYPQGSEKHLIKSITKREVPSGGLPIDVGCIVFNIQTALAIKKAVCEGQPLIERVLTVSGFIEKPKNLRVKIGTLISEILEYCTGKIENGKKCIIGGPMMGINIIDKELPVMKGTSGILILPEEKLTQTYQPCIRCGKCIEVCPMRIVPAEISRYAEVENWKVCNQLNVGDCIECGCCSYICPAKRPLVEWFKWAKAEIKKQIASG